MPSLTVCPEIRPDSSTLLPLVDYDRVIVSFSGGKDSVACVLELLDQGVDPARIELWHQGVDGAPGADPFMDWPCTDAYCQAFAQAMGLRLRRQWKVGGFRGEMLRQHQKTAPTAFELEDGSIATAGGLLGKEATRRKFPQVAADLKVRWCSAYLKIDVAAIALNNDPALTEGDYLFVTGERRQESPGRARYATVDKHRCSNRRRRIDGWRPIIEWSEERVWAKLQAHGILPHPAYQAGFGRTSCMTCIFADDNQWATIRAIAPQRFEAIAAYERDFGTTIRRSMTVVEAADRGTVYPQAAAYATALLSDDAISSVRIPPHQWTLPVGAFKRSGGPI